MKENGCFPVEAEAFEFITTNYEIDYDWVEVETKRLSKKVAKAPKETISQLIQQIEGALINSIEPANHKPKSLGNFHLPSFLQVIDNLETKFLVSERQMNLPTKLGILAADEMIHAARASSSEEIHERREKANQLLSYSDQIFAARASQSA